MVASCQNVDGQEDEIQPRSGPRKMPPRFSLSGSEVTVLGDADGALYRESLVDARSARRRVDRENMDLGFPDGIVDMADPYECLCGDRDSLAV